MRLELDLGRLEESHLAGRRQAAFDTDGRQGAVWAGWGVPWGPWTGSDPKLMHQAQTIATMGPSLRVAHMALLLWCWRRGHIWPGMGAARLFHGAVHGLGH